MVPGVFYNDYFLEGLSSESAARPVSHSICQHLLSGMRFPLPPSQPPLDSNATLIFQRTLKIWLFAQAFGDTP